MPARSQLIRGALGTHKVGGVVAFDELELKRIDRTVGELCRRCSPPEHADELRTVYEVEGHIVSVYEERPPWRGEGEWTRMGVARFRYVRSRDEWQLYWMRQDLRWHPYSPEDEMPRDLPSRVALVDADAHGAFFG
jgi:Protein of unknown function (DUF3024)